MEKHISDLDGCEFRFFLHIFFIEFFSYLSLKKLSFVKNHWLIRLKNTNNIKLIRKTIIFLSFDQVAFRTAWLQSYIFLFGDRINSCKKLEKHLSDLNRCNFQFFLIIFFMEFFSYSSLKKLSFVKNWKKY